MKRALFLSAVMCSFALASEHGPDAARPHDAAPAQTAVAQADQAGRARNDDAAVPSPADEAMQALLDGNDRFRYEESSFPRLGSARRNQTFTDGQKPFAAILGCADSRMPVEAIFDQGVGDLFVVRVAGNVADTDEIGTLEYGVEHLHIPLIVVLGHTKCGAVTAVAEGAKVQGHVGGLVDNIAPAVVAVKLRDPEAHGARLVRLATRANVAQAMHDLLSKSDVIAAAVKTARLRIIGGVYDIQSGGIEWLGPHPRQAELIAGAQVDLYEPAARATTDKHDDRATGAHDAGQDVEASHDAHPKPTTQQSSQAKPRKENWVALGSLLGLSTAASLATIHFLFGRASV